jgi:hypothetical protein
MVADGPGAAYLRENCPRAGFVACEFVDHLPSNSDTFLWDTSPATGIYAPAQIATRQELGKEQYRFAAAVLAYDPVGQIVAAFNDAFQQLKMVGLSDFAAAEEAAFSRVPQVHADRMATSPMWKKDFPMEMFSALTIFTAIACFVFAAVILFGYWKVIPTEQKVFCFFIFLGLLANAFVCGALSGPHERYQARLTWLLPVVAILLFYKTGIFSRATRIGRQLRRTHQGAANTPQLPL